MKYNELKEILGRESPNILTAIAITSSASLVIFAAKGTISAIEILNAEGAQNANVKDKVKLVWRCYAPTALALALNIACIGGVYSILSDRNKVLSSLYLVAVEGLREYQNQVVGLIGEKKNEKLLAEISKDKLDKTPIEDSLVIFAGGDVLFFDAYSGRYFRSSIERIKSAVNEFNHDLFTEMFKPLNEFYYLIGLSPVEAGEGMGWGVEKLLSVDFTAQIVNAPGSQYDKQPCIALSFDIFPHYLS